MNRETDENLMDVLEGGPTGRAYTIRALRNTDGERIWRLAAPEKAYAASLGEDLYEEVCDQIRDVQDLTVRIKALDPYAPSVLKAFRKDASHPLFAVISALTFYPRVFDGMEISFGVDMLVEGVAAKDSRQGDAIFAAARKPVDDLLAAVGAYIDSVINLYPAATKELTALKLSYENLEQTLLAQVDDSEGMIRKADDSICDRLDEALAAVAHAAKNAPRKKHRRTLCPTPRGKAVSIKALANELSRVACQEVCATIDGKRKVVRIIGRISYAALRRHELRHLTPDKEDHFGYCRLYRVDPTQQNKLAAFVRTYVGYQKRRKREMEEFLKSHRPDQLKNFWSKAPVSVVRDGDMASRTKDKSDVLDGE